MTINYPVGQGHSHPLHKKKQPKKKKVNYGKRGMSLESNISKSNEIYRAKDIAVIYKKPTPIQVVDVDYPKRSAAVIKKAYYRKASTTDYNGIYRGYYIDFEAKETRNKTTFPLQNFHQHQIDHLVKCNKHGGISFVIISFTELGRLFALEITPLNKFWQEQFKPDGKKSIALKEIEKYAIELPYQFNPIIPYIDAVDIFIAEKENTNDE